MSEQAMPVEVPTETATIRPTFHHVNLKTLDLDRLIDWYGLVLGTEVTFRYPMGAWLTNDGANHRIALLALPGYVEDAYKQAHTGMHHMAFEYDRLEELMATYDRLKGHGIVPFLCFDHGMTLSLYYADPDGNGLELQIDVFGDWDKSSAWMREAIAFQENPLGVFFDPEKIVAGLKAGLGTQELHERAFAGEYLPDTPFDITVPPIPGT